MPNEIYLAGGCFWGVEAYFSRLKGITKTEVGYANGEIEDPTYEEVCIGQTGYAEAVYVQYDAEIISLEDLLFHFFEIIDPTTLNRQSLDTGSQYRSGIYYTNDDDIDIIKIVMHDEQKKYQKPIVTEVKKLKNYYKAEEYHQKYLDKNPNGYCHIDLSKI